MKLNTNNTKLRENTDENITKEIPKETENVVNDKIDYIIDKIGINLDSNQREAVKHINQPLVIIALPGGGKTVTTKIKEIVLEEVHGVPANKILSLTYSTASAKDMKNKHRELSDKLGLRSRIEIRTLHSLFYGILGDHHGFGSLKVMEEWKRLNIFSKLCGDAIKNRNKSKVMAVSTLVSYAINNMITKQRDLVNTLVYREAAIPWDSFIEILQGYKEYKNSNGYIDYDDIQTKTLKLLQENDEVRNEVQSRWTHYTVDEFQDISVLQLEILKLIVANPNNLTVIGDDDQTIYEWRGSSGDIILDFPLLYPNTKRIILNTNYRCPEIIMTAAEKSIVNNVRRMDKQMVAPKQTGTIDMVPVTGNRDAGYEIAERIEKSLKSAEDGYSSLDDIGVIYHNHLQSSHLIDYLLQKDIPVRANINGLIYSNSIVVHLLECIDMIQQPRNGALVSRILYRFVKYMSYNDSKSIGQSCGGFTEFYDYLDPSKSNILHAATTFRKVEQMLSDNESFSDIAKLLIPLYKTGTLDYLLEKEAIDEQETEDVISYLQDQPEEVTYPRFIENMSKAKSVLTTYNKMGIGVNLTTMHSAKGLEFDTVYLINDSDVYCPQKSVLNKVREMGSESELTKYIEQERRLHYVAITRAKENLVITYPNRNPSPFLVETGLIGDIE